MRDSADKALSSRRVVHSDHWCTCARHQVVPARVERHAVHWCSIGYRLERLLGRRLGVVEQFDGEVVGPAGQDRLLGVELQTGHLLGGDLEGLMRGVQTRLRWYNVKF